MKKSLIILQTTMHTETIHTDNPNAEVNKLMQLHHNNVVSIIVDGKVIYIKK